MSEAVVIAEYDPAWPLKYNEEKQSLERVFFGVRAAFEHVGSTAVPGLGAKPIIDILAGVAELRDAETRVAALAPLGYEYVPAHEAQIPERRYFRKPRAGPREFHLHCVVRGSALWLQHLAFRDFLRSDRDAAARYYALKKELAARFRNDRVGYNEAKSSFVDAVLRKVGVT